MNFGFSTFFFIEKPIRHVIRDIVSHGVKTIELSLEVPHVLEMDEGFVSEMTTLRKDGVAFSIHAPFFEMNLGSHQKEVRRFSRKRCKMAMDMAQTIGCNPVVLHPGYVFWMDKIKDVTDTSRAYFLKGLKEMVSYGKKKGVKIALEQVPMPFFFFYDLPEFMELRQAVPDLGMTLDIGHAYLVKRAKGVDDPEGAIINDLKEIGVEWVSHVHLANNRGKRDDHLVLDGDIDVKRILKFLEQKGYGGKVIVESYDMEKQGISVVLEKLTGIMS